MFWLYIKRQKLITRHSVVLLPYYPKSSLSWEFIISMTNMVSYDLLLFMLKIETTTRGTNSMPFLVFRRDHLRSTSGIICGSGSGSFAVQFGIHLRSGDYLRRFTNNQLNKISSGGKGNYRNVKFCKNNSLKEQVFLQSPLKN